jgi:hypothetical protein
LSPTNENQRIEILKSYKDNNPSQSFFCGSCQIRDPTNDAEKTGKLLCEVYKHFKCFYLSAERHAVLVTNVEDDGNIKFETFGKSYKCSMETFFKVVKQNFRIPDSIEKICSGESNWDNISPFDCIVVYKSETDMSEFRTKFGEETNFCINF